MLKLSFTNIKRILKLQHIRICFKRSFLRTDKEAGLKNKTVSRNTFVKKVALNLKADPKL